MLPEPVRASRQAHYPVQCHEAERLAADAAAVLGADDVALFPPWETLPFERVSPAVETMGQRLRTLHRLQDPSTAFALSRLSHGPYGPTPIGIFRNVPRAVYEDTMDAQISNAIESKGEGHERGA